MLSSSPPCIFINSINFVNRKLKKMELQQDRQKAKEQAQNWRELKRDIYLGVETRNPFRRKAKIFIRYYITFWDGPPDLGPITYLLGLPRRFLGPIVSVSDPRFVMFRPKQTWAGAHHGILFPHSQYFFGNEIMWPIVEPSWSYLVLIILFVSNFNIY